MILSKKEIQELIDLVKNQKLPEEQEDEDPLSKVNKFILFFKIKEGKNKVYFKILYEVYKKWDKSAIPRQVFAKTFSKFFQTKRDNTYSFYSINYKPNQLIKKIKQLEDKRKDPNEK